MADPIPYDILCAAKSIAEIASLANPETDRLPSQVGWNFDWEKDTTRRQKLLYIEMAKAAKSALDTAAGAHVITGITIIDTRPAITQCSCGFSGEQEAFAAHIAEANDRRAAALKE